ncbi:alpha/beta-hydrolase [Athelia psychrophila]|uniref:Alpha/beta-hydrolase n=1 Tax=Athelia psychrophila TaxID=1759441 RepID=A0A166HDX3_9AGAM|nr:alpha/beta-hydrolase [Fibularhizoctonia sp. CBS 109695]
MSLPAPSSTTWGDPNAAKRALLIHGLISCSQSWNRVADALSAHGYYVVAPDLLGHGYASRPSTTDGAEYTIAKLAANLKPLLPQSGKDAPISLIIGHSLGCLVALDLLPSLSSKPRVVLVDPSMEISPEIISVVRDDCVGSVTRVASVEQMAAAHPRWTRRDAIAKVAGNLLCDAEVVDAVLQQNPNSPWSYTDRLPSGSELASITIVAGDPAFGALISANQVEDLKKSHPHIRTFSVDGASHDVHRDFPEIVVREALKSNAS